MKRFFDNHPHDLLAFAIILVSISVLIVVISSAIGCTADAPLRWPPTEQQKQAADLTVQDIAALQGAVPESHESIRQEAAQAARTAQTYIGLPDTPIAPVQPENVPVLAAAQADASKEGPSLVEAVDYGMDQADTILTILGSIAGAAGLGVAGVKIQRTRKTLRDQRADLDQTFAVVSQLVEGIQRIKRGSADAEFATTINAELAGAQTPATQRFIQRVKSGAENSNQN